MSVAVDLELSPGLDRVRELARDHNLVPLRHTFIADCETPVSAYLKLRGEGPSFLLESAEQGQRVGRWSFLGFRPRATIRMALGDHPDPYAAVAEEMGRYRIASLEGLPPFAGGAVGLFGYDLVRSAEPTVGVPNPDEVGLPDLALMLTDLMVGFDHLRHEVTLLANVFVEDDLERSYEQAATAIAEVKERLAGPVPQGGTGKQDPPEFFSNLGPTGYGAAVGRAIEYIHAGDAYQVVPSQRWTANCPVEAFSIYRGLRAINPSPYMYFLDFEDFQIAGASPESLVKVSGDRVELRPIAGTRPRTGSDDGLADDLLSDEKERAEHVMLVDLGRNDLGRVCEYGSVKVDELMAVETYSHVIHIVSSVSGRLRDGVTPMDALRATLPAGTLSGAPKIRAMQIIDELEPVKRGPYGGAVGYLSYTGDLDTCINIRATFVRDGKAYLQAGGGIVADSDPGAENRESEAKAGAVMDAIRLACAQREWA
ncbi:MAG TPA: anthranilate synthase component I [Thermoleophilaceae bacterium]|nr:anthranilate synthase component I [Thermoleophilaceae bacterium]